MTETVSEQSTEGPSGGGEGSGTEAPARRRWSARVRVMPRPEILDPQGKAISSALGRLGFADIGEVRAGKSFDLVLAAADRDGARAQLERMCTELLANPIIEDYELDRLEELDGEEGDPS